MAASVSIQTAEKSLESTYAPGAGRHRRPIDQDVDPGSGSERRTVRIQAAEQMLSEVHRTLLGAGADPDAMKVAFAIAHDCFHEARATSDYARRELELARYERREARKMLLATPESAQVGQIPDLPGSELYPDPSGAQTDLEYVSSLRTFHLWSGKASYRAIARQCGQRFAASTIYAALHGDKRPSLAMVQAIVRGCGGSEIDQQLFATVWRRLELAQQPAQPAALKSARRGPAASLEVA